MTLHRLFFGLGLHIVVIIVSVLIVRNISASNTSLLFPLRDTEILTQEQQLMNRLSVVDSKSYKENDIKVIIKQ